MKDMNISPSVEKFAFEDLLKIVPPDPSYDSEYLFLE